MSTIPTFARPADRSFEGYVAWIKTITAGIGGSVIDDPIADSPEAWRRDHADFWKRLDEAAARNAG